MILRAVRNSSLVASLILATARDNVAQSLAIVEPLDGTHFTPGQRIIVKVRETPAGAFKAVMVLCQDPIGFGEPRFGPPYDFELLVPIKTEPGEFHLSADGVLEPGRGTQSGSIRIVVERAEFPVGLRVKIVSGSRGRLKVGTKVPIEVTGIYEDGTTDYLNNSPRFSITSYAPGIISVSRGGVATPMAPGSTHLVVTYGSLRAVVPVTAVEADSR